MNNVTINAVIFKQLRLSTAEGSAPEGNGVNL